MNRSEMTKMRGLPAAAVLLALVGCGAPQTPPTQEQPAACTQVEYDKAVMEAIEPTQEDIVTDLYAISPSNPRLQWNADKSRVRMVVWTTFGGYTVGNNTLTRDVFVTAAPQVQELCKGLTVDDAGLVARLNQYLGLPPATASDNNRRFAEMWVRPEDLFRPCPDAEIDDATCGLQFPASATADHKAWVNGYYASSYGFWQTTKYPWTGLGYTYDWCSGTQSHVGASEYVVRRGAVVDVLGYVARDVYCAK